MEDLKTPNSPRSTGKIILTVIVTFLIIKVVFFILGSNAKHNISVC